MDALGGFSIDRADPGDVSVRLLIEAHLAHSWDSTPQTSNHTLGVAALRGQGIRFWTVSDNIGVVGCGALKALSDQTAEVKSVHVAHAARGRGVAKMLMEHLIETARQGGTKALVLETGSMDDYKPARGLYKALGFTFCGLIPGYDLDPNSVFMRLALDPAEPWPQ